MYYCVAVFKIKLTVKLDKSTHPSLVTGIMTVLCFLNFNLKLFIHFNVFIIFFQLSLLNLCKTVIISVWINSIWINVKHFDCWAGTFRLELLKSTVKKDCLLVTSYFIKRVIKLLTINNCIMVIMQSNVHLNRTIV